MPNKFQGSFFELLLIAIFIFACKQIYDAYKVRKTIGPVKLQVNQKRKIIILIAAPGMIILGLVELIRTRSIYAILYIFLGLVFTYLTLEKICLTDKGIYFNGRFDLWENVKKWEFSDKDTILVLKTKNYGKENMRYIPINSEDKSVLNQFIREHKK